MERRQSPLARPSSDVIVGFNLNDVKMQKFPFDNYFKELFFQPIEEESLDSDPKAIPIVSDFEKIKKIVEVVMFIEEQLMNVISTPEPTAEKLVDEKRDDHLDEHESHETSTSI